MPLLEISYSMLKCHLFLIPPSSGSTTFGSAITTIDIWSCQMSWRIDVNVSDNYCIAVRYKNRRKSCLFKSFVVFDLLCQYKYLQTSLAIARGPSSPEVYTVEEIVHRHANPSGFVMVTLRLIFVGYLIISC